MSHIILNLYTCVKRGRTKQDDWQKIENSQPNHKTIKMYNSLRIRLLVYIRDDK